MTKDPVEKEATLNLLSESAYFDVDLRNSHNASNLAMFETDLMKTRIDNGQDAKSRNDSELMKTRNFGVHFSS
jgi:hypothetical protein